MALPILAVFGTIGRMTASTASGIGSNIAKTFIADLNATEQKDPHEAAEAMAEVIRRHFSNKYPGSKHYSPSKVKVTGNRIDVPIPGVGRAYHDIDIYPKNAAFLTIPVHPDARGKLAREIPNLFKVPDHDVLAANENGSLVVYYALSEHVHQNRDSSIMPTDRELSEAAGRVFERRYDSYGS